MAPSSSSSWTAVTFVTWTALCLVAGISLGRHFPSPTQQVQQQQQTPQQSQQEEEDDDPDGDKKASEASVVTTTPRTAPPTVTNNNDDDNNKTRRRMLLQDEIEANNGNLILSPIGVVRSVYSLCVGTPRQGLLAPAARGRIELFQSTTQDAAAACDGLTAYSHIWILFIFHLNTQQQGNGNSNNSKRRRPSKIAPPAAGGPRVGVWSTRSPHRPSPIGLSLVRLDGVRTERRYNTNGGGGGGKPQLVTILDISGLDLVDGTPVLDIKPYVPVYDTTTTTTTDAVRLPDWVAQGLQAKRSVTWTVDAADEFLTILQNHDLQFYDATTEVETIQQAIEQVLRIDVRSVYQTTKARKGDFQAERSHRIQTKVVTKHNNNSATDNGKDEQEQQQTTMTSCTQQLDNLLIHYTVQAAAQAQRSASVGSGAEDVVRITSIQYLPPTSPSTSLSKKS